MLGFTAISATTNADYQALQAPEVENPIVVVNTSGSGFYKRMRDSVAHPLLTKYNQGELIYIRKTQADRSNPNTSTTDDWFWGDGGSAYSPAIGDSIARYLVQGITRGYDAREDANLNLEVSDRVAVISAQSIDFEPDTTDNFDVDGVEHVVTQIRPVPASGTPVIYKLALKIASPSYLSKSPVTV